LFLLPLHLIQRRLQRALQVRLDLRLSIDQILRALRDVRQRGLALLPTLLGHLLFGSVKLLAGLLGALALLRALLRRAALLTAGLLHLVSGALQPLDRLIDKLLLPPLFLRL